MRLTHTRLFNLTLAAVMTGFIFFTACTDDDNGDLNETPGANTPTQSAGGTTTTPGITSTPGGTATRPPTGTSPTPGGGSPSPGGTATQGPGGGSPTAGGDASAGEELFVDNGCSGCHSTGADAKVGPGLAGVYDRAGDRVDGLSAEEYIEQSLREPGAHVVEGFQPLMPSFASLSDDQVQDLIAYLRTLD